MQFGAGALSAPPQATAAPPLELLDLTMEPTHTPTPSPEPPSRPIMRRWMIAIGAVAVVVAIGVVQLSQTEEPAFAEATPAPLVVPPSIPPTGAVGFAEMYVSSYLTATGPERQSIVERFYPAAPEMDDRRVFDRYVTRSVVVDAESTAEGFWSFTVAAEVLAFDGRTYVLDGIHHYLVAVATPDDRPFAAISLPTRISTPPAGEISAVVGGVPVTDEAIRSVVGSFVRAYTTGSDELFRFTAATFHTEPITPAPFTRVEIAEISSVVLNGQALQVRIAGRGIPETGAALAIEYHLRVVIEGGAWKVLDIAPGPVTAAQLEPAPDTSADDAGNTDGVGQAVTDNG